MEEEVWGGAGVGWDQRSVGWRRTGSLGSKGRQWVRSEQEDKEMSERQALPEGRHERGRDRGPPSPFGDWKRDQDSWRPTSFMTQKDSLLKLYIH